MDFSNYDLNGLTLFYKMITEMLEGTTVEMETQKDLQSDDFKTLSESLLYYSTLVELVSIEIKKRQSEKLLFSVGDIFRLIGQFDMSVIIYFYPTSVAYKKYGEEIHGHIIYARKNRKLLTELIAQDEYERADGIIKFNMINGDQKKIMELKNEGFLASDIYKLQNFDSDPKKVTFMDEEIKEIPNTISIPFESEDFNLSAMENLITSWKFKDGTKILDHEMLRYHTNEIILGHEVAEEDKEKYLYEKGTKFYKERVLIQLYQHLFRDSLLTEEQRANYLALMRKQEKRRISLLKKDLGITNQVFEKFKLDHSVEYRNTRLTLSHFVEETLTDRVTQFPIYWDEERFIHIYGRHYVNYFINFSTYQGTHFQYTFKDIRRLICLILKSLEDEIEAALQAGKQYDKYGDQGYYFNGNYYTLRIDKTGKLMTFYPMS